MSVNSCKAELLKEMLADIVKYTITAVQPRGRFGTMVFKQGFVMRFEEKSQGDGYGINGGFRVLDPFVIDMVGLNHLMSYYREGF